MFSVNISKLVEMSEREEVAYKELCNNILTKEQKFKTLAVLGENGISMKFAEALRNANNKVLFIDADFSTSVFVNKYKLGKDLKGICDYLYGSVEADRLVCLTDRPDMNVIFTGDTALYASAEPDWEKFDVLMGLYKDEYDYIILDAANYSELASKCDGTLYIMDNAVYSEEKAKKEVEKLSDAGCLVIGVVINNI